MVTTAKRWAVVGLVALLLAGGGTAALDWDATALAGGASKPVGDIDAQGRGGERRGEEIPSGRGEERPIAQAGGGAIGSGGEF
jgi:hypothetical protein